VSLHSSRSTDATPQIAHLDLTARIFADNASGYLSLAKSRQGERFTEKAFSWPRKIDAWVERYRATHDLYWSPMLYQLPKRNAQNVSFTPCLWADLDTCHPDKLHVALLPIGRPLPVAGKRCGSWTLLSRR